MVYDGFKKFMDIYMEAEIPEELCKHLFLSLMKTKVNITGQTTIGSTSASTHPAVAITANPAVEKSLAAGDDSTPDASTHSRSSSKKSNHSVNTIHNGKK